MSRPLTNFGPCTGCGQDIVGRPPVQVTIQGGTRTHTVANRNSKAHYHLECCQERIAEMNAADRRKADARRAEIAQRQRAHEAGFLAAKRGVDRQECGAHQDAYDQGYEEGQR